MCQETLCFLKHGFLLGHLNHLAATNQFLHSVRGNVTPKTSSPAIKIGSCKRNLPFPQKKVNIILYIYIVKKHVNSPNYLQVYTPPTILI